MRLERVAADHRTITRVPPTIEPWSQTVDQDNRRPVRLDWVAQRHSRLDGVPLADVDRRLLRQAEHVHRKVFRCLDNLERRHVVPSWRDNPAGAIVGQRQGLCESLVYSCLQLVTEGAVVETARYVTGREFEPSLGCFAIGSRLAVGLPTGDE